MKEDWYNPREYVCTTCGKHFYRDSMEDYVYRRQKAVARKAPQLFYFCGWNCMRAWDREQEEKEEAKKRNREEVRKKALEEKQAQVPHADGYRPVTEVKIHYVINRCGKCGKQVAVTATECKNCGAKIDWSVYEPKEE